MTEGALQEETSLADLIAAHRPGHALSRAFYTDARVWEADREAIFARQWHLAGHTSELPEPGDYLLFDLLNDSVIVTRDNHGTLRAFANVCRHRGARLCTAQRGHVRGFTCPYHAWRYDLNGALVAARQLRETDADAAELGLAPVAIEVFCGLIYVSLAADPQDFTALHSDLAPLVAPLGLAHTRVAHRACYEVEANWKLVLENYNECYHCANAHPEYSESHAAHMDDRRLEPLGEALTARAQACGTPTRAIDRVGANRPAGAPDHGHYRYPLMEGFATGSADGTPLAPRLGELTGHDGGASDIYVGMLNPMLVYCDHAVLYRFLPLSPDRTAMELIWLVHEDAAEGRDYDLDRLIWLWDVTTRADKRIIEANARGVADRHYRPGPLMPMEIYIRRFIESYHGALLRAEATT